MDIRKATETGRLLQEALQYHRAGQMQKAEQVYRRVLSLDPDNGDANHLLGLIACQFNKIDIGIRLIRRAIQVNPGSVSALLSLGNVLMSQGDLEGAVSSYQRVLAIKPDFAEAHNNLGNALASRGDFDGAAASFRQAIAIKPDYAEAHNNLGNLYNSRGNLDEAIASYRQAIALKPDYAEAYNNLGTALTNHGDVDGAAAALHKALAVKPDYGEAYNNLGNLHKGQGNLEEAVACYRKSLALKPDDPEFHNNLGLALQDKGDLDGAAASYRKALAINPDYAEVHNNIGNLFLAHGNFNDAEKSFNKVLSLKPDYAGAYVQLAFLDKQSDHDREIKKMAALLADEKIGIEDRIELNFSLGKLYEGMGQYEKAFTYIEEGNRLKRDAISYNISDDEHLFTRVQEIFNRQLFSAHESSGYRNATPIFILGMPRSGSTLIEQILASHPEVHGAGEIIYLQDTMASFCKNRGLLQFPDCAAELADTDFEGLGRDYVAELRRYSEAAKYVTNKMPHNFIYAGLIKLILPEAKIIHSLRDPRDTCWSIFKNSFHGIHNYAFEQSELGKYYRLYQELMQHWRSVLPGVVFEMRYEDLVADQEYQTRRLLAYCQLEWHDSCLSFYKTSRPVHTLSSVQVRQPLYNTSVQLWKHHEKALKPLLTALQ